MLTRIWGTWDNALKKAEKWGLDLVLIIALGLSLLVAITLLPYQEAKIAVGIFGIVLLFSRMFYVAQKRLRARNFKE